jgi:hypothetical protein
MELSMSMHLSTLPREHTSVRLNRWEMVRNCFSCFDSAKAISGSPNPP